MTTDRYQWAHDKQAAAVRLARECRRNARTEPREHRREYLRIACEAMQDARDWQRIKREAMRDARY